MEEKKPTEENRMTEEEMRKALSVPERDVEKYPDLSDEEKKKSASFLYKLNLMASSVDGNLCSLVWTLYRDLEKFLTDPLSDENIDRDAQSLIVNLVRMKSYILSSGNPVFNEDMKEIVTE